MPDLINDQLTMRVDDLGGGVSYVGYARPGSDESKPVWQIRWQTYDGDHSIVLFANGNDHFFNIWDERASLTYS